ncbi:MAG: very short patch repair endonuclease [Verrucomicrobiota bacterium]
MADIFTKEKRPAVMAAVRSTGNKDTEVSMVRIFRTHGIKGWRRHLLLTGKPDFAFPKERVAVFVDGCFWHGCSVHCRMPASNRSYWRRKIGRNVTRDRVVTRALAAAGWTVLRVWEHNLRKPGQVVRRVVTALAGRDRVRHN